MAKLKPGDEVHWIDQCPDGSATPRRGVVWSVAPGRTETDEAWWVIEDSFGETVRVLRAPKRLALGIERPMREDEEYGPGFLQVCGTWEPPRWWRPGMTKWVGDGGPVVKKGTLYREVDNRSASMRQTEWLRERHRKELDRWART